jgi:hypothetical protein
MHDVDVPVVPFNLRELRAADVSGQELGVLRNAKSDSWCNADCAMPTTNGRLAGRVGRVDDQQSTQPSEVLVERLDHRAVEGGNSIDLLPGVGRDQHQAGSSDGDTAGDH